MKMHESKTRLTGDRDAALQRISTVTVELATLAAASFGSSVDDERDPEGATIAFERDPLAGLRSQAETRLIELDAALVWLSENRYGRCELCGALIADERLAALSATRLCLICAARRGW